MPLFLKDKSKRQKNNKRVKKVDNAPNKKRKLEKSDEEIATSDDEDIMNDDTILSNTEDEDESPQDKKLRLAKIYLKEIEQLEKEKLGKDAEVDKSVISKRLNEDYLKEVGKFRSYVAVKYSVDTVGKIDTLKCRQQKDSITCLCLSSDNDYIFTGSKDGIVVKWNIKQKKKEKFLPFVKEKSDEEVIGHSSKITSIAISFDDKYLAVGDESSEIMIWCPKDLTHLKTFRGHNKKVMGLTFRKNTHTLYSCSADRNVKVWSLDEMMYIETLFGHQSFISSIDSMFKERAITSGCRDGTLRIWKIPEESQLVYNGHTGCIDIVRFINEEHFISGGEDGQICIWSFMKKKPVYTIKNAHGLDPINQQPNWICSIATLVNTDLFASGSYNGVVKFWKMSSNFKKAEFLFEIELIGYINSMAFSSTGDKLIVGCSRDHRFGRYTFLEGQKLTNCIKVISFLIK